MRLDPDCYTNVIWVLVLCLLVQSLIISENKVHCDNIPINTETDVKKNGPTAQQNQQVEAAAQQNLPNNAILSKNQSADSSVNTNRTNDSENVTTNGDNRYSVPPHSSSDMSQETAQPSRKNISTGAFVRAFYVSVGLGAIIVMYIVVRTIRLRRKKTAVRKYGILASQEDVEMTPLGAEDEEEDATLFDMTSQKFRP